MQPNAYTLKAFYKSPIGKTVQATLSQQIKVIWDDLHDLDVLGLGYAPPYSEVLEGRVARMIYQMPVRQGVHPWPENGKNRVAISECGRLPYENNTIDRILVTHALEFFGDVQGDLQELWRILRPAGRMIIIVPNRSGLWSLAESTPFGKGHPYTSGQIFDLLMGNRFAIERSEKGLYFPPLSWTPFLRASSFFEKYLRYIWPFGGVHIIEVSKQLHAPIRKEGRGSKVPARQFLGVEPVPQG